MSGWLERVLRDLRYDDSEDHPAAGLDSDYTLPPGVPNLGRTVRMFGSPSQAISSSQQSGLFANPPSFSDADRSISTLSGISSEQSPPSRKRSASDSDTESSPGSISQTEVDYRNSVSRKKGPVQKNGQSGQNWKRFRLQLEEEDAAEESPNFTESFPQQASGTASDVVERTLSDLRRYQSAGTAKMGQEIPEQTGPSKKRLPSQKDQFRLYVTVLSEISQSGRNQFTTSDLTAIAADNGFRFKRFDEVRLKLNEEGYLLRTGTKDTFRFTDLYIE